MGADFIDKATPTFKKSFDRARIALATADLFTREPNCAARTAAFDITRNAKLRPGDQVTVELDTNDLVALQGNAEVARSVRPPQELLSAVRDSCGVAKGVVQEAHDLAGVVEISVC